MTAVVHASVGRLVASAKAAELTPILAGGEWTFRCPVCPQGRIAMTLTRSGAVVLQCSGEHGVEVVLDVLGLDRRAAPTRGAA